MSLERIESNISSFEEQAKTINKTYKSSIDIIGGGIEKTMGIFGMETIKEKYQKQLERIKLQTKENLALLKTEVEKGIVDRKQKEKIEELEKRSDNLSKVKVEDVSIIDAAKNTDCYNIGKNALYGLKGEYLGTLHGVEGMLTSTLELAKFLAKYSGSLLGYHPEYKTQINEQTHKLWLWANKEGWSGIGDKISELWGAEITKIQGLPEEQQAEAIGNIAGNIIALLVLIKGGLNIANKTSKVAGQVTRGQKLLTKVKDLGKIRPAKIAELENIMAMAKKGKNVLEIANVFLNGVAESMIGFGLAKTFGATLSILRNRAISVSKKIAIIENTIEEAQKALKIEKDLIKKQNIEAAITKLSEEKNKFERIVKCTEKPEGTIHEAEKDLDSNKNVPSQIAEYNLATFERMLKDGEAFKIIYHLEKFVGLDINIHYKMLFDSLLQDGEYGMLINNLNKFKIIPNEYQVQVFEKAKNLSMSSIINNIEKFTELDQMYILKSIIDDNYDIPKTLLENFNKFTKLDQKIVQQEVLNKFLYYNQVELIIENLERFDNLNKKGIRIALVNRLIKSYNIEESLRIAKIFNEIEQKEIQNTIMANLIDKDEIPFILAHLEKFDKIEDKKTLQKLILDKISNGNYSIEILENFGNFTKLDQNLVKQELNKYKLGKRMQNVFENINNYAPLKQQKIFDMAIEKGIAIKAADKLRHYNIGIKGNNKERLFEELLKENKINVIFRNIDKFDFLNRKEINVRWEKYINFVDKTRGRKNDIAILNRYQELSHIENFEEIFRYYIENKPKQLIPMMQKLLIAKDIGIRTNFKPVTDLINLSWIKNTEPAEIKRRLLETFEKISEINGKHQSSKELKKFLDTTKIFDNNVIEQIKKRFTPLIEEYFNRIYDKKIQQKIIKELGLTGIENFDKIMSRSEIMEGFKMYQKTRINKEQFRQILQNVINNPDKIFDISILEKNAEWLKLENIKNKNMGLWLETNERVFEIGEASIKVDRTQDIEHFLMVANEKLKLLGLEEQKDAGKLKHFFNSELKKNVEVLKKESKLTGDEFDNLYADLALQVNAINDLFKETKAKSITGITIYKETDPAKALMMGNLVDNSCLSFYSTVGNYWSTATNALDINKGVFFIKDQNGNIIGRVLTAIDDDGKILKFRTYIKGNIDIDLDGYFNEYIKGLSEKIGLGLNGDIDKVKLLIGESWYKDPVVIIQ